MIAILDTLSQNLLRRAHSVRVISGRGIKPLPGEVSVAIISPVVPNTVAGADLFRGVAYLKGD